MKKVLTTSASLFLAAALSTAAWAAATPIGALVVQGKADITANDATFTLEDQEYAYFSSDRVETGEMSRAVLATTGGLKVALGQSSVASITWEDGAYIIDLQQGSMAVDAREGIEYRVTRNGDAVSGGEQFIAGGEPYVASMTDDDVRFYMPAQLDQAEEERRRLLAWLLGGATGFGFLYKITKDDDGPSS